MTRTKALLVVGCIMLALAVMAALELKQEVTEPTGQAVTGLINKTEPPVQTLAEAPKPGALVPLDQGTLRPEESRPAALPETAPQAETSATTAPGPQTPQVPAGVTVVAPPKATTPPNGQHVVPVMEPKPAQAPAKTSPEKLSAAAPVQASEQTMPEQALPEQAVAAVRPETKKSAAEVGKTAPAEAPAVRAEPQKTEPKAEKNADEAPDAKADEKADDKADGAVRTIDTAGPVKVEKGQKAIVWTRLELADKSAVFRLSGAEKVEGKAFALPNPDRYVVDLTGDWAMRLPAVPKNSFIKKIRVGKYGDNTRMVLDLSGARNCQMVRINPTTLEFRIK